MKNKTSSSVNDKLARSQQKLRQLVADSELWAKLSSGSKDEDDNYENDLIPMRLILTKKGIAELKKHKIGEAVNTKFLSNMRNKNEVLEIYIGKDKSSDIGYDSLQAQFDDEENISRWRK